MLHSVPQIAFIHSSFYRCQSAVAIHQIIPPVAHVFVSVSPYPQPDPVSFSVGMGTLGAGQRVDLHAPELTLVVSEIGKKGWDRKIFREPSYNELSSL
jgi:hypothetical protein